MNPASPLRFPPSKLPRVGTTIFTTMSQLAAAHGAVNLGQGFPDFDPDPRLIDFAADAMRAGHNQYAPMPGVAALREAIAAKNALLYGHRHDPEAEITITAGATQALMSVIAAFVLPGDEVVVLEPAYDSYVPAIELAGGVPVLVPLDAARGYAPDWERVRRAITPRTRILIVNFPHNPTGRVLLEADLRELEAIIAATGVMLLSDEVYEHIVFDGAPHRSVMSSPLLAESAIVVSSFGKTLHTTGWKIGSVCAPARLTAEFRKVHQFTVFAVNTPGQFASERMLREHPGCSRDLASFYQTKRDLFLAGLQSTRLRALPCAGTYFVLVDYSAVSDEPEAIFARRLITEFGVAAIPVSAFYQAGTDHRVLRLCFAKRESTLDAGLERLMRV